MVDFGIIGYGVSGRATVEWCRRHGHSFLVYDDRNQDLPEFWTGEGLPEATAAQCWIVSPGVPPRHKLVQKLVTENCNIDTDVGLFTHHFAGHKIGFTGTNGKTTVTEMTAQILNHCGYRAAPLGNFGQSPLDLVDEELSFAVLELSSFQLYYSTPLPLLAAGILNVSKDHLDWHSDWPEYVHTKGKIFLQADFCVLGAENDLLDQYSLSAAGHRIVQVGLGSPAGEGLWLTAHGVSLHFDGREEYAPTSRLGLKGKHNLRNMGFALLATVLAGCDLQQAVDGLIEYHPGAHRLQEIHKQDSIGYINDSKATNPHAVEAALEAMAVPVVLLLGGVDKGGDFSTIGGINRDRVRAIVVFGRDRELIAASLRRSDNVHLVAGMSDAVLVGRSLCRDGDVLLLSPGCASFDEFTGYANRGDVFRELVNAL